MPLKSEAAQRMLRGANPVPPLSPPQPQHPSTDPLEAEAWFTRESLRGWGTSLSLHGALLLAMAFWYFVPGAHPARVFDTRLAGSEMGVDEGLTVTGGLNTPIELMASPTPSPEPTMALAVPLDLEKIELKASSFAGAAKTSAGGGMDNPNPGAGNGDGFGLAKFGQGGESVRGVEVKVGDPQFTLLWDSEADLDLHVIEPGGKLDDPGEKGIYWEHPKGELGGELDVDNTKGFGPENIYWLRDVEGGGQKVKGPGPPGTYQWFVVYWGGFGGVVRPTKWKVRIKHDGKITIVTGKFRALNEQSKVYTLKVTPPSAADATATK